MKGPGRRRRPRPGPCGGVHGVHAARGARGVAGSSWQGLAQRELDDIGVAGVEGRLAIRQVEGPDAHEAFVKALGTHGLQALLEGLAPAPERFRIVAAECQDRKSTRLNSSHLVISYAVFCL